MMGRAVPYMKLYKPLRWSGLYNRPFAISKSTYGGQLVNEFFIYSEDITLSPEHLKGWRIFKVTTVILGPKLLSELLFKPV